MRGLGRHGPRRPRPWLRVAALVVITATVVVACSSGGSSPSSTASTTAKNIYWGGRPPDTNVQIPALPAAAATPPGSLDDAAATLAGQVETGGDAALPAIVRALNLAGVTILDNDGSVLLAGASPGAGISIDRWEVVSLGMFAANPTAIRLSDLSDVLTGKLPVIAGQPLGDWMLAGLRTTAQSQQAQARFLARFIVELGRQQRFSPDDILGSVTPPDVMLDGVALELLLRRLSADLFAYAMRIHASPIPFASPAGASPAALVGPGGPQPVRLVAEGGGGRGPCAIDESAGHILDATAVGFTTAFDKLTEYLVEENAGAHGLEALKNFGAVANIVLALAKLIAYYSSLKVTIDMQAPPPLTRTKTTTAGEMKTLVATASMDVPGFLQMINCFRIMLNFMGMDVSMPTSGALADSQASWVIARGGGATGGIVRFTRADPANPGSGDPVHQRTDENGKTSIGLEGTPQSKDLGASVPPVNKAAEVWVTVQPKPPSFSQDMIDASVGISPGLGLIGVVPVEMLLRSSLLKPAELPFKVIDWGAQKFRLDFDSVAKGDVITHFTSTMKIDGMVLGDPTQGNAVAGTDGKNNVAYGAHDVNYTFEFHGFCGSSDTGPIDPVHAGPTDPGPPAEAALFFDTSDTGQVSNLRLTLFPGNPTETFVCPADGQYPGSSGPVHEWSVAMEVLHSGGPCPGVNITGSDPHTKDYVHICGFLSIGDGVWQRTFSGPGNKSDVPGGPAVPAVPGLNATEETTVTITLLPDTTP